MTRRLEKFVIGAVALHSMALGGLILICPVGTLGLAGFDCDGSSFFIAQAGVFLLILGGAYLAAVWHRPFAWLLVASKATAVVFLLVQYSIGAAGAALLLAAVLDGLMGASVAALVVWNSRAQSR